MLANSEYSPSTRSDIQKTYLKGSLARINSGALAEGHLTQIHQAELQRAARRKGPARVVPKGRVITVSKAREKKLRIEYIRSCLQQIGHNLKLKRRYIWRKCGRWLEGLKESKDILSMRKQDRKKWQVFIHFIKGGANGIL